MDIHKSFYCGDDSLTGIVPLLDMSKTILNQKNAIIIGAIDGIGYEFARLIAKDAINLILVDFEESLLIDAQKQFKEEFGVKIRIISEDLSVPTAAENIFDASLLYHLLNNEFGEIDLMINCLTFEENPGESEETWDEGFTDGNLTVFTLLRLNELFARKMTNQGTGKILNVVSCAPKENSEYVEEMYMNTLELVEEFSTKLGHKLHGKGIQLDGFFSSPSGMIYRGMNGKSHLNAPPSSYPNSLLQVAKYGYDHLGIDLE